MKIKSKQYIVLGLGRFGKSVSMTLAQAGYEVMVVDQREEVIQDMAPFVTHAVKADITDADTLKELGVRNFDVAIVAVGKDMQASIMATLLLKEMGVPFVLAKASTEIHQKVLEKLGADRIVFPEDEMGRRIAANLVSGNILDYIQLSKDYSIMEVAILERWAGKTIKELDIRKKHGINIIAVEQNKQISVTPSPDLMLEMGDVLVVVGNNKAMRELEKKRYEL